MTDNILQDQPSFEISKDFRASVAELELSLRKFADGENIVVGTSDKPIVSESSVLPIEHFFMDGVYVRKMTMRKDSAVIGAVHKHLHMCFLTKGCVLVSDGTGSKEYKAPCHIIATPGVQRVLYAQENSVWYNTHKNPGNIQDVSKLEEEIVSLNYEEYEEYIKNK
tara:strand:+ start:390 stop:887 length:498 start_codon:yes stop_codon:yes gene_type:complete